MCGDGLEGVKQDARGHQLLLGVLIGFGLILPLVILLPVSQADSIDRETEKALVVLTCLLPSVAAILAAVFVFSTATPFRRRWVLGLIIGLLTLPTFLFLPILVLERPGPDAQAALIFLALIPHVVLALVWTLLELLGDTIFDDFMDDERRRFFRAAAVVVGAVMMVLLICVLIPVHQEADINHNPRDMLLVMIFLNLVLWIPLMLGTLSADFPRGDFLMWYLGYFVSISLPFATFLPILFTGDHSNNGQSTLITFAVSSLVIGFTFLLGPRIADKVATSIYDPPSTPDEEDIYERKQTLLELGFGLGLIAVLVLLVLTPVHEEATLGKEPRRTIFALILILLVYAIVYAPVRFFGCTGTRTEQAVFGLGAFFLIALPLLILLPITLEDSHSDSGLAALIFFMLFPWLAFIGLLIYLALTDDPTLVFRPIDLLPCSDCNYSVAKYIYAAAVLLFPVVLLLPIYFEADLHSLPRDMLLFFVIAIPTLCAVLFFIAFLMEPEETANLDDLGWDHSASVVSLPVPSNVSAPDDSHHNGTGNGTGNGAGHNNQVVEPVPVPGGYLAPAGGNEQPAESRPDLLPIEPIDVGVNNALVRVTCPAIKLNDHFFVEVLSESYITPGQWRIPVEITPLDALQTRDVMIEELENGRDYQIRTCLVDKNTLHEHFGPAITLRPADMAHNDNAPLLPPPPYGSGVAVSGAEQVQNMPPLQPPPSDW